MSQTSFASIYHYVVVALHLYMTATLLLGDVISTPDGATVAATKRCRLSLSVCLSVTQDAVVSVLVLHSVTPLNQVD